MNEPIDYQTTLIYKITCKDETIKDCYIGHTTNFVLRLYKHKSNCKNEKSNKDYNFKVYEFIRSNGGWNNFKMEIIIHYPCNTHNEASIKEQEYITSLNATLNSRGSVVNIENKKKVKQIGDKKYRESHKDQLKESKALAYEKNKEKVAEQHKIYRDANEIKYKTKYTCACGKEVQFKSKWSHEKTNIHKDFIKENKINVDVITV